MGEEDACFIGSCPELFFGGCHGTDAKAVFSELCEIIEETIDLYERDGNPFRILYRVVTLSMRCRARVPLYPATYVLYFLSEDGRILDYSQSETLDVALHEAKAAAGVSRDEWYACSFPVPENGRIPHPLEKEFYSSAGPEPGYWSSTWWVEVRLRDGRVGWTHRPEDFGNKNACG